MLYNDNAKMCIFVTKLNNSSPNFFAWLSSLLNNKISLAFNDSWMNKSGIRLFLTPFKIILTFLKGVKAHISRSASFIFPPFIWKCVFKCLLKSYLWGLPNISILCYTANIYSQFTVIGCVTFPTVIWQWLLQPMTVHMTITDIEEYSLRSNTVLDCTMYNQITVGNVTLPKAVLSTVKIFAV